MALEIFRLVGSVFVDTDKADKSLKKTDKEAGNLGKSLINGVKNLGKFAVGIGTTVAAAGGALVALTETTREYRTEQGKLTTAFETNNFSAEAARKTYEELNGILGDSGQAVEAASHLAKLTDNEKDLEKWTKICTGVYATFGDSLPIEGLTEAANETAKVGTLTGSLADALNWAGVNEEAFQAQLDACTSEQERQALITDTLNGLYTEAADHYRETNAEVIAANKAQDKLNQTMAKVGAAIEPIITQGKLLLAEVLERASPYIEQLASVVIPWLVGAITGLVGWIDTAIQTVQDILAWLREMGAYAGDSLKPIIDDLAAAFDWVKQRLDPLISAVKNWVTSGKAAEDITNAVKSALDFLGSAYVSVRDFIGECITIVKDWVSESQLAKDIADGFKEAIEFLGEAFEWIGEQLEPFVEALAEYFTSGEAAEDITNALQEALNLLEDAYESLRSFVEAVIQGFKDANTWMQEHEQLVGLIAIALGTLTAAIVAYNAAQAIKNAGGIAEIAQLAATQLGLWGLTAAETAHTAASTVAAAVTTAFGAAVSFLTSPITLVVLAIGALIAIIYLLVTNWDTVKAAAIACWEWIKDTWNSVATWFDTNVIQPVAKFFTGLWDGITSAASAAWQWVKDVWAGVAGFFAGIWDGIKSAFGAVGTWFKDVFSKAWQAVKDVFSAGGKIFDGIKEGISNVFTTVVNAIIRGINKVIAVPFNAINGVLKKLKSIEIAGIKPFNWVSTLSVPEIPELEEGAVLKRGQVGLLEGNGAEAVVPLHNNKKWIGAVARDMEGAVGGSDNSQVVAVLLDILEVLEALTGMGLYIDKDKLVGYLAKPMDKVLGQLQIAKGRS